MTQLTTLRDLHKHLCELMVRHESEPAVLDAPIWFKTLVVLDDHAVREKEKLSSVEFRVEHHKDKVRVTIEIDETH